MRHLFGRVKKVTPLSRSVGSERSTGSTPWSISSLESSVIHPIPTLQIRLGLGLTVGVLVLTYVLIKFGISKPTKTMDRFRSILSGCKTCRKCISRR